MTLCVFEKHHKPTYFTNIVFKWHAQFLCLFSQAGNNCSMCSKKKNTVRSCKI